jgi:hypothetical protein
MLAKSCEPWPLFPALLKEMTIIPEIIPQEMEQTKLELCLLDFMKLGPIKLNTIYWTHNLEKGSTSLRIEVKHIKIARNISQNNDEQ